MDGTLADSREYHWKSWQGALAEEGVRITRADFERTFGWRNAEILRRWLGPEADPDHVARVGDAKEIAYRDLLRTGGLEPLPGASHWVRALRSRGWRQAIASSAPRANIEAMLEALGFSDLIDAYVGAEDVTRGKPDPEVFLTAAARVDIGRARCIVVEDAPAGIEAARRAGMKCIRVGEGRSGAADVVVLSLTMLSEDAFDELLARSH